MTLDDGPIKAPPPESPGKDAAATNRVLGTLVVVVLRAKNLTNRVRIGKQNPYTTVTYGLNKKRTETIERGGQQPTWDTEFRFEILKDSAEQLAAEGKALVNKHGGVMPVAAAGEAAARLQQQHAAGATAASGAHAGKKVLRLACYADDPKDPKLVGEGTLDLESTIKKGAFDDWVKLERKGRYAGEIYLELTWYSSEPPPEREKTKATLGAYGGPGSRTDDVSDEDQGAHEWDDDSDVGRSSTSSQHEIAADYPDADLAPLSNRMSMLNMANRPPLPAPPIADHTDINAHYAAPRYHPGYDSLPAHPSGYAHGQPHSTYPSANGYPTPSDVSEFGGYGGPGQLQGQNTIRASTYNVHQQHQSPSYPKQTYASHPPDQHGTYAYQEQGHGGYAPPLPPQSLYAQQGPTPPPAPGHVYSQPPAQHHPLPPVPPQPPATPNHWGPPQPPQPPPMRPQSSSGQYGSQAPYQTGPPVFAPPPSFAMPPPHPPPPPTGSDYGHMPHSAAYPPPPTSAYSHTPPQPPQPPNARYAGSPLPPPPSVYGRPSPAPPPPSLQQYDAGGQYDPSYAYAQPGPPQHAHYQQQNGHAFQQHPGQAGHNGTSSYNPYATQEQW